MRIISIVLASIVVIMGTSCASHKSGMTFQSGQSKKTLIKEKISLASALYDAGEIDAAIATLNELIATQRYTDELSEAFENLVHFYLLNGERKKAKLIAGQFMRLHWQSPRAKKIQELFDHYKATKDGINTPVEKSEEVIEQPQMLPTEPAETQLPQHEPIIETLPPHEEQHHEVVPVPPVPAPVPAPPAAATPPSAEVVVPHEEHKATVVEPKHEALTPSTAPVTTPAPKEEVLPSQHQEKSPNAPEQKSLPTDAEKTPLPHDLFLDREGHTKGNNATEGVVK